MVSASVFDGSGPACRIYIHIGLASIWNRFKQSQRRAARYGVPWGLGLHVFQKVPFYFEADGWPCLVRAVMSLTDAASTPARLRDAFVAFQCLGSHKVCLLTFKTTVLGYR